MSALCASGVPCGAVAGPEVVTGWELVAAAQGGDREAFGQLYERYVGQVFGFVLFRVGGDRLLAEDLTSETFLRALRGISSVRDQGRDVGAWLITIARNLVRDHRKSHRSRRERVTAEPGSVVDERRGRSVWPGVGVRGPEDVVIEAAEVAELMRGVAALPRGQRDCVLLRFLQELSVVDTAAVMGRNVGAVKALQHRALRRLAQLVEPQRALVGGEQ